MVMKVCLPGTVAVLVVLLPAGAGAEQRAGVTASGSANRQGHSAPAGETRNAESVVHGKGGLSRFSPALPASTPDETRAKYLGQPAPITSFIEALDRAYWTHPALLSQRATLTSTDYRLPQARAAFGPNLSYEANLGFQRDNFEDATGQWTARSGWTRTASAIIRQPVFTFGRNKSAERQAMAEIEFQRTALRTTETETFYNALSAYAAVLRDREGVEIVRADLALLEREYADSRGRFGKREVTVSDVQQVETRVEQSRAELLFAQRTIANSEAAFLASVGAPAGVLGPPNPLIVPVRSLEEAYEYADQHNPVLAAAYARERISRAGRDSARADLLPRVDLRGTARYGTVSPYQDQPRQTALRGELMISGPIFDNGAGRGRVSEAESANDADWRLIDAALRENRREVAESWNDWLALSAAIGRLELAANAARKALEGALLQEKAGLRSTLDVLSLARELFNARREYNAATADAYVAQARLLAVIGALERSTLFPDLPAYDPDQHFDKVRNAGNIPILTPVFGAIDGWASNQITATRDRLVRDPSAGTMSNSVEIPRPREP